MLKLKEINCLGKGSKKTMDNSYIYGIISAPLYFM